MIDVEGAFSFDIDFALWKNFLSESSFAEILEEASGSFFSEVAFTKIFFVKVFDIQYISCVTVNTRKKFKRVNIRCTQKCKGRSE